MSLRPIPVLLYHRIEPEGVENSTAISTSVDVFGSHLRWLASNGYRSLNLPELEARINGAEPFAANEVVLTFDDGYDSLGSLAVPILRETGLNATAFLITQRVDKDDHIDWGDVRMFADEGVLDFHSHSHSHQRWPLGSVSTDDVIDDLATSRETLAAELGRPDNELTYLAWPYGRTCDTWDAAALELGFTTQFVVQRGAVTRPGRHLRLPRLMVDGMPLPRFTRWMRTLSTRSGAHTSNRTFGMIRQLRSNPGYI